MAYSVLIKEAGLTDGEAKVYLALLKLGSSTTGPIIDESGVANSIIYRILNGLVDKGLASYIIKEKTKYFQAAEPKRLLDYIEERKEKLDESKEKIKQILPELIPLTKIESSVRMYEGFRGFQTAFENVYSKLKKGEEFFSWGIPITQDERYHLYWKRGHIKREQTGVKCKMLFDRGTDKETMINRNSYKGCEARYMPNNIQTKSWFHVYADVSGIFFQGPTPLVVEIVNQDIADSFRAYFNEFWQESKPFV